MNTSSIYENGTYLSNNPTWHEEDSQWKAKQIDHILKKNNIRPLTICEIGCGSGEVLNQLSNHYDTQVSFSGYDISPQAFDRCHKKEKHNLHFFLKDLLTDHEAVFDVAMAIDVFEHVEDYFEFLRKFKEKGEYKIFHIPLDLSAQAVLRNSPILNARATVGHIHYFMKDTALAILKETGYEILDYFYTKGSLELPNDNWKTNLLKLPRKLSFHIHQDMAVRILGGFSLLVLTK